MRFSHFVVRLRTNDAVDRERVLKIRLLWQKQSIAGRNRRRPKFTGLGATMGFPG
jgi:hypothetical protein